MALAAEGLSVQFSLSLSLPMATTQPA